MPKKKSKVDKINDQYPFGFAEFIDGMKSPINRAIFRILDKPMKCKQVAKKLGISERCAKMHLDEMHRMAIIHTANLRFINNGKKVTYSHERFLVHVKIVQSIEDILNLKK